MSARGLISRAARVARPRAGLSRRAAVLPLAVLAAVVATAGGAATLSIPPPPQSTEQPSDGVRDIAAIGLGRSVPVRIVIPSIEVAADIVPLGLSGGKLAALPDARRAGWYERGTSPGELGSAVILGRGVPERPPRPAVFARLDTLAAGDRIQVVREDGAVASFVVDRVERLDAGCEPSRSGCGAELAPQETGAEAQLRLVSHEVVVWATLAP